MKFKKKSSAAVLASILLISGSVLYSNINTQSIEALQSSRIVNQEFNEFSSNKADEYINSKLEASVTLENYKDNSANQENHIPQISDNIQTKMIMAPEPVSVAVVEELEEVSQPEITRTLLPTDEIAKLVLNGAYGNGDERKTRLETEGYDYNTIQQEVTKITPKPVPKPVKKQSSTTKNSNTSKSTQTTATTLKAGKTMIVEATAYSMNEPGLNHQTSTGVDLRVNSRVIAVDPRVIPYGSYVEVEGYGTYLAADTGGAIKGKRIDLHFNSLQEMKSFGRRTLKITILQ